MVDEQDDIVQYLNSSISLWECFRSGEFWQEYREKGELTALILHLLIFLNGTSILVLGTEPKPIARLILAVVMALLLITVVAQFINELQIFRINEQIKTIEGAQLKAAKSRGEIQE